MARVINKGRQQRLDAVAKLNEKGALDRLQANFTRLKIEYIPVNRLKPNDWNPNRQSEHEFNILLNSIEENGFTKPIVVNQDDVIVDGEHRWRAATTLGFQEIPVVRVKMDASRAMIATIRHNEARGQHDSYLEAEVLKDLQKLGGLDWAIDTLQLDEVEVNHLLNNLGDTLMLDYLKFDDLPSSLTDTQREILLDDTVLDRDKTPLIREAQMSEDIATKRQEKDIYRISFIFAGDEAKLVRDVVGDTPAHVVLSLCKKYQDLPFD